MPRPSRPRQGESTTSGGSKLHSLIGALMGAANGKSTANPVPTLETPSTDPLTGNTSAPTMVDAQGYPVDMSTYQPYQNPSFGQRFWNPGMAAQINSANINAHSAYLQDQLGVQSALQQQAGLGPMEAAQKLQAAKAMDEWKKGQVVGDISSYLSRTAQGDATGNNNAMAPVIGGLASDQTGNAKDLIARYGQENLKNGLYNAMGAGDQALLSSRTANAQIPYVNSLVGSRANTELSSNRTKQAIDQNEYLKAQGAQPNMFNLGNQNARSATAQAFNDWLNNTQRSEEMMSHPDLTGRNMEASVLGNENQAAASGLVHMVSGGAIVGLPSQGRPNAFMLQQPLPTMNIPGMPNYKPVAQPPTMSHFSMTGGPMTLSNFGSFVDGGSNAAVPNNQQPDTTNPSEPAITNNGVATVKKQQQPTLQDLFQQWMLNQQNSMPNSLSGAPTYKWFGQ